MNSACIVGIDLGTSNVKAGLYDLEGRELALAGEPLSIFYPRSGYAEQDPPEWWLATQKALRRVLENVAPARVAAVGLCAQCPGHVLATASGEALGRAIIWRDQRAGEEADWLAEKIGPAECREWLGVASAEAIHSPAASPARILWIKNHCPARLQAATWVLQPKDYLGLLLTGEVASDIHTAYLLAHPLTRQYSPDYLSLLGLAPGQMPPLRSPDMLLGRVTRLAASLTGLTAGTPVYTGTIDAFCDTLAGGGFLPGKAVDVAGTSEIVSLGTPNTHEGGGVYLSNLEKGGNFLCGPMQAGSSLLDWIAALVGAEKDGRPDFTHLEALAGSTPAGADGLLFLPYLHGERAPIWDTQARGAFLGISCAHDQGHFVRAVYEGVALAVRHVLEACEQASGSPAEWVIVCGGGSRSLFWNSLKANVLQRKVFTLQARASACLGAAIYAGLGSGEFMDLRAAWSQMGRIEREVTPDPAAREVYDCRFRQYLQAYPAVKTIF